MEHARSADRRSFQRLATGRTATDVAITNKNVTEMTTTHTKAPECCGQQMTVRTDIGRFLEVFCEVCKDSIYIKKQDATKPQMIDD